MIIPRTFAVSRIACLCVGILLALASLDAMPWAGTTTATEPTVSLADLEGLVQQIEDPQQRVQLPNTLRALIAVARQGQAGVPSQKQPSPFSDQSQGLFFAFGELTQHLASIGRKAGPRIAMLPMIVADLPARLAEPATFWHVMSIVVSMVILMMVGIIFQLIARRMKKMFDARGIEIPFPHRTIYWGRPKRGEAAPGQFPIRDAEALATTAEPGEGSMATRRGGDANA